MTVNLELSLHSRGDGFCSANSQPSEFLLCGSDGHLVLHVMEKEVNFFNQGGYAGTQSELYPYLLMRKLRRGIRHFKNYVLILRHW